MTDQLHPIPLVTPGFKGLNTAQASVPDLDPAWAIQCQNFIFDSTGRLAARNGWVSQTTTRTGNLFIFTAVPAPGSVSGTIGFGTAGQSAGAGQLQFSDGEVTQAHYDGNVTVTWTTPVTGTVTNGANWYPAIGAMGELAKANGQVFTVSAANNHLFSGTTTLTDITGSLTITGNNWQFVTFNNNIYGIQSGHPLIVWSGSGNFILAPLAAAKAFTGSIAAATATVPTTLTVTAISSGVLGSGDTITTGAATGTQIVAQLTGITGGIGTYQINLSQTVSSASMQVAAGVVPSGGSCGLAAFGRLWILNADNQTISYCSLIDATTWNGVGAGSINLTTVWTRGIDTVMGIAAAGSKLIIFGVKQIIIYFDQTNPAIGINPTNLAAYDTIEGTGLVARDSVQSTGEGDLTFLSATGIQSLQRLLSSGKDNPVASLDTHVHDYVQGFLNAENPAAIRSAYSPSNRFYILLLPASQRAFVYDTRFKLQGSSTGLLGELPGALRVTEWPNLTWTSVISNKAGQVLFGENGQVGLYSGYTDNLAPFTLTYLSPNLALAGQGDANYENRMKILKRMKAVFYFGGSTVANISWGVDFKGLAGTYQVSLAGILSEYGTAQYGISEYGGGAGIAVVGFPLTLSGRWIQFGLNATINGYVLAIQQLDAFVKIGNMV